jgi:hypothetical protein
VAATGATLPAAVIPAVAVASGEEMTSQNVVDALVLGGGRGCSEGQGGQQDDERSGEVHSAGGRDVLVWSLEFGVQSVN